MLKINKDYSDYTDETDENYPEGKAINTSSAESVDGTPVLASFLNNVTGALQGMYKKAYGNTKGIDGIEDNVNQSQFVDAIEKYTQDQIDEHAQKRGLVDSIHGATSRALGGQIVSRDALGSAEFSVPLSNTAVARRGDIYDLTKGVLCETPENEFAKVIPSSSYPGFTLQNGVIVRILFQFGASKRTVLLEETEKLTLNVCGTGAKKIFVKLNGVVEEIKQYEIEENTVYFQAFTDMNLIYIETLDEGNGGWLIMNNPVIISNNNEITYADGSTVYNKQTVDTLVNARGRFFTTTKVINGVQTFTWDLSDSIPVSLEKGIWQVVNNDYQAFNGYVQSVTPLGTKKLQVTLSRTPGACALRFSMVY